MIFENKFDFEEYIEKIKLERIDDYPSDFIEDSRNYQINLILTDIGYKEFRIKFTDDVGFPRAVIINNANTEVNHIRLRRK